MLFIGADLLVTHAIERTLVATRSFDSRWRWVPGRERSPVVTTKPETQAALGRRLAEAVRRATGADCAVAGHLPSLGGVPVAPGVTRVADLESLFYGHTVDMFDMTGAELLAAHRAMAVAPEEADFWVGFQPAVKESEIDPAGRYRVALPMALGGPYGRLAKVNPRIQ